MKNPLCHKFIKKKRTNQIDKCQQYILSPTCNDDIDPLQWWKLNQKQFSGLAKMAMDFLPIPSTSVASEECFSISKNLITDRRNKLVGKTIRASMCLKSWLSGPLND